MADWQQIKTEYVTTDISYRKLASKHSVPFNTLQCRAKREKWFEARGHFRDKVETKTIALKAKKEIDRYQRLLSVADKLLDKIDEAIDGIGVLDSAADKSLYKSISGAIRDIKEIQGLKANADIREQEARIAKLRKESEDKEQTDNKVEVIISGGADEYSE